MACCASFVNITDSDWMEKFPIEEIPSIDPTTRNSAELTTYLGLSGSQINRILQLLYNRKTNKKGQSIQSAQHYNQFLPIVIDISGATKSISVHMAIFGGARTRNEQLNFEVDIQMVRYRVNHIHSCSITNRCSSLDL